MPDNVFRRRELPPPWQEPAADPPGDFTGNLIRDARAAAAQQRRGTVTPVHLGICLFGSPSAVVECMAGRMGRDCGAALAQLLAVMPAGPVSVDRPMLARATEMRLVEARSIAQTRDETVGPQHVLLALLRDPTRGAGAALHDAGWDFAAAEAALQACVSAAHQDSG